MKFLLPLLSFVLFSCASNQVAERKPVPPKGSDDSSMPWNTPGEGSSQGAFQGLSEGR
ncbi:hypothetical protein N9124_00995 [bacterium]|nr:hypothetical protein [Akkermansiaceae bacterium]MDB4492125.1 hypothetical protein [bacterium]MDB4429953.1 hypothetical protein [Akkermansiaceae bacterium]MDB4505018.1 hypothetical protein [Akkermansiaceae bacterium]MDB4588043.1 hypothetical protein [bacterium]